MLFFLDDVVLAVCVEVTVRRVDVSKVAVVKDDVMGVSILCVAYEVVAVVEDDVLGLAMLCVVFEVVAWPDG